MDNDTMRAAVITRPGDADVIEIREVPRPKPDRHEILVRVVGSALNRADLLQRAGKYPAPIGAPPDIPGLEFAGVVAANGESASRWKVGDAVMGIVAGGAHAEYLVVHEDAVVRKPERLSFKEAGTVPEVFITAFDALRQASLKDGEYVLIHAAASGVGLAAIQLAKLTNAIPFGTTRSGRKSDAAIVAGAAAVFSLQSNELEKLEQYCEQYTYGNGFDVVLDLNGGPYLTASLRCIAQRGRVVCIGTSAGAKAELHLGSLLHKRASIIGTVLRARSVAEKIEVAKSFSISVRPWFEQGKIRLFIDSEFSLDQIREAHRRLESNETTGKVALKIATE